MGVEFTSLSLCGRTVKSGTPLYNPLVTLRRMRDEGRELNDVYRYGASPKVIKDIEGLSRRLWHSVTVVTPEMLLPRLNESPSQWQDLGLLERHIGLIDPDGLIAGTAIRGRTDADEALEIDLFDF